MKNALQKRIDKMVGDAIKEEFKQGISFDKYFRNIYDHINFKNEEVSRLSEAYREAMLEIDKLKHQLVMAGISRCDKCWRGED